MPQPFTRLRNDEWAWKRIAARPSALAMTRDGKADCHSRSHISSADSVGASASQRCQPDTRTLAMTGKRKFIRTPYVFAITKRRVILSAKRERIRNILKKGTDCHGAKAPHNDKIFI